MNSAISIQGLSKAYQLGQFSTGTLSQDMERWWTMFRGKDDPYLSVDFDNSKSAKNLNKVSWSLKDINLEINKGEVVGVIGRNGAGKSTLLKLISQVTSPTSGSVKIRGRVASLLEVGTGFHPELTGRENIFLNGAILGMKKREILRKFDEIVDFSGVEKYIDTPVKRYSSGMYVRLAFSVAANLESEVLIVDEVLAVGDSDFQNKCLGKMGDLSKGEGKTVLFVSHNMESIRALCNKSIYLNHGKLLDYGNVNEVIYKYQEKTNNRTSGSVFNLQDDFVDKCYLKSAALNQNKINTNLLFNGETIEVPFVVVNDKSRKVSFEIILKDSNRIPIAFAPVGLIHGIEHLLEKGSNNFNFSFMPPYLAQGVYYLDFIIAQKGKGIINSVEDVLRFQIESTFIKKTSWTFMQSRGQGCILITDCNTSIIN